MMPFFGSLESCFATAAGPPADFSKAMRSTISEFRLWYPPRSSVVHLNAISDLLMTAMLDEHPPTPPSSQNPNSVAHRNRRPSFQQQKRGLLDTQDGEQVVPSPTLEKYQR